MNEQSLLMKAGFTPSLLLWAVFFFQELFPANKRSCEHFAKYFTDAGLKELSDFVKNQQSVGARKELQKELQQQISCGEPLKDVSLFTFSFTLICGFYVLLIIKINTFWLALFQRLLWESEDGKQRLCCAFHLIVSISSWHFCAPLTLSSHLSLVAGFDK